MFNRIVSSIAARLPATSAAKRNLVTTAFWHLQDVAYTRLRDAGFDPKYIIDIGACSGDWSRSVRQIFPKPAMLLVEARQEEEPALRSACEAIGNASFNICLLGSTKSDAVAFSLTDTGSSLFPERSNVAQEKTVLPMMTLDTIAAPKAPTFIKIDVQGAELEILKGAPKTMEVCEVIQLEVALLNYNEGAPTAAEVITFMDQSGFAFFDVAGFVRPLDKHLIQLDLLFVRKTSKLRPETFTY
jgi:FkbM family methyltransferase